MKRIPKHKYDNLDSLLQDAEIRPRPTPWIVWAFITFAMFIVMVSWALVALKEAGFELL